MTILWDMPVQSDKVIKANRPDIVVTDKEKRTCLPIDISVPNLKKKNTSLKTEEKLSKYKDLEIPEIEKTWKLKTTTRSRCSLVLSRLSRISLFQAPRWWWKVVQ